MQCKYLNVFEKKISTLLSSFQISLRNSYQFPSLPPENGKKIGNTVISHTSLSSASIDFSLVVSIYFYSGIAKSQILKSWKRKLISLFVDPLLPPPPQNANNVVHKSSDFFLHYHSVMRENLVPINQPTFGFNSQQPRGRSWYRNSAHVRALNIPNISLFCS